MAARLRPAKSSELVVSAVSFCCAVLAKLTSLTGKTKFSLTSASLFSAALHPNQRKSGQDKKRFIQVLFVATPPPSFSFFALTWPTSPGGLRGALRRFLPRAAPAARPDFVKGDRPKTNSQARVLRKKNTMKNQDSNTGLQSRAEQSGAEAAKFIIILIQGREQVVAFPVTIQHSEMLASIRQQHREVQAVSAGFFMGDVEALWAGGESTTLDLPSRQQDVELIRAFLASPQAPFNFIVGGAK